MSDTRHARPSHPRHQCPAPRCNQSVPQSRLMCGRHWRLVPEDLKRTIYREYPKRSAEWAAACAAAVAAIGP